VRSVDGLEEAAKKCISLRKDGLKISPPYFDNSLAHEKWINAEKLKALI